MSNYYRSLGDVSMRHRDTFVGVLDPSTALIVAYYVENVTGSDSSPELVLRNKLHPGSSSLTISINDTNLMINRPLLGMVNHTCGTSGITYAMFYDSKAYRQIKKSLTFSMLNSTLIGQTLMGNTINIRMSPNSKTVAANHFFNQTYPLFSECLSKINTGEAASIAFSSKFALTMSRNNGILIGYKNVIVGLVTDGVATLREGFEYLQEQLEEESYGYA